MAVEQWSANHDQQPRPEAIASSEASRDDDVTIDSLRIHLLGLPEVLWRGHLVTLPRRQTRALLFRLVASPRPVPREALFALLWPDVPESTARRQLTVLLNHLRRELPIPDVIDTIGGAVGLRRDAVWTDVASLDAILGPALERRTVDALHEAFVLLRGPFLQGFTLTASPDFDAWLTQEREVWQRHTLDVLAALTDAHAVGHDYSAAIAAAQRYLELDALAEDMHRRLMGLLAASGDRAAALRQFDACADMLERELDVSPLPETWALWESIRTGTIGESDTASHRRKPNTRPIKIRALPTPPNAIVGREREVADACAMLQDPSVRLLTLTGPGGSGKTRLALEIGANLQSVFADGVAFVPLAHLRDHTLVLDEIARAYGLREQAQRPLAEALRDHLQDRRTLLVLDNVEHLLPAATGVAELMVFAPQLHVLATSRTALHLAGEHLLPARPLPLPVVAQPLNVEEVEQLKAQPALALLLARARAHSPAFQLTPGNAADLAAICAQLDGLPLAIELAAARLKILSPAALLERLNAQHALLINGPADLPERQQTLRATIDWSYHLLDDGAQRLLERLSVFAGGWTLDAAEAVCANGAADSHAVLRDMDALLDNSLIERAHAAKGDARFRMLATIQAYALDRLQARGSQTMHAATRAHLTHFCSAAQRAAPHLRGVDQGRWLESLDDEHANLFAALEASFDLGDAAGLRLACALSDYWLMRGMLSEGRRYLERALALPSAGDDDALADAAQAHQAAGQLALMQGDFVHAREQLRVATGTWRSLNREGELALALILFSGASGLSGDVATAIEAHAEAHQLAVALPDPDALALVHLTHGIDARNGGDYALARRLLHTGLVHFRRQGDAMNLMHALLELIPIALAVDGAQAAQARANEVLALARQLRNQPAMALALNNLGEIARHDGHFDRATVFYACSLQLWQTLGNANDVPRVWHNQAYLALHRGQLGQARSLLEQSMRQFQALGMSRGVAECVAGLACLAAAQGQPARAATLWGAAEISREQNQWGVWPADQVDHARALQQARAGCDATTFDRAWQDGRALSLEGAVSLLDE